MDESVSVNCRLGSFSRCLSDSVYDSGLLENTPSVTLITLLIMIIKYFDTEANSNVSELRHLSRISFSNQASAKTSCFVENVSPGTKLNKTVRSQVFPIREWRTFIWLETFPLWQQIGINLLTLGPHLFSLLCFHSISISISHGLASRTKWSVAITYLELG